MTNLTKETKLIFIELKKVSARGKTFENTVQGFIDAVYTKEAMGRLDIGVEPLVDEEGDLLGFTPNKFWALPLEKQLEMAIEVNDEDYGTITTWKVAEDE